MLQEDIDRHLNVIEASLHWAHVYGKDSFPVSAFRDARRRLKKYRAALEENCSAAAYGESQVGKSYLISGLLSSPEAPFVITNKGKEYSFIDQLNTSGGRNAKVETTGVITRFTIKNNNPEMADYVRIRTLGMVDLVLLLVDSYYNDVSVDTKNMLDSDALNQTLGELAARWKHGGKAQGIITADDVEDICEYIEDVIGHPAVAILKSEFRKLASSFIESVPSGQWVDVFGLLWNKNEKFNNLFNLLVSAYEELKFSKVVYVPFEAVLQEKGSLLDVRWLDEIWATTAGTEKNWEKETDVFTPEKNLLVSRYGKAKLSALTAELTFVISQSILPERPFLEKVDLLDFPGARSREKIKEQKLDDEVMPQILRRGKVAYLFNKYSRSMQVNAVLFCHHNDQKGVSTMGETIREWIDQSIGNSPEKRVETLERTKGVSPLFFVATKFNIELQKAKNDRPGDKVRLSEHWKRFDTVIPEIVQPYHWMEEWIVPQGKNQSPYFRSIYLLRDFYWSGKNQVFEGYSDGVKKSAETGRHQDDDYPDYWEELEESFLQNSFVKNHFAEPKRAWDAVAQVNCDGSKPIIRDLNTIAEVLDDARHSQYLEEARKIRDELLKKLEAYYEPEDKEAKNRRVKNIADDLHRALEISISKEPEIFGRIIDRLMIPSGPIRDIAYNIIVLQTIKPVDFTQINFLWGKAHVSDSDSREIRIRKLCSELRCVDEQELEKECNKWGISLDDLLAGEKESLSTQASVLVKNIVDYWSEYINKTMGELSLVLPHADLIASVMLGLLEKLKVKDVMVKTIDQYEKRFNPADLPNAVADYTTMVLNNFVSTVGRTYMKEDDLHKVRNDAQACQLADDLDFSESGWSTERKPQDMETVLNTFENMSELIRSGSIQDLRKLPWWDNFLRWENLLIIGVLYASDIAHVDPEANAKVRELITQSEALYKN